MTLFLFVVFFLLIDYYFFQGVLAASKNFSEGWKNSIRIGFWGPTALCIMALLWWTFGDPYKVGANARNFILTGIVATYFSKSGFDVKTAATYKEALRVAGSEAFDLVISDIALAEGDGLELLSALKSARPNIPVVMMTILIVVIMMIMRIFDCFTR